MVLIACWVVEACNEYFIVGAALAAPTESPHAVRRSSAFFRARHISFVLNAEQR